MKKLFNLALVALFPAIVHAQDFQTASSTYKNNLSMRDQRKIGVGTQLGGVSGLIGVLLELNIEDQDGALVNAGFGSDFSTFTLSWKHNFEGQYFTPYATAGWSRWYNSTTKRATNSHVLTEILSDGEKNSGRFGVDFLTAGAGLQYQELAGDFAGTSFFGEVNLLTSPTRGHIIPTAAIGATYFF